MRSSLRHCPRVESRRAGRGATEVQPFMHSAHQIQHRGSRLGFAAGTVIKWRMGLRLLEWGWQLSCPKMFGQLRSMLMPAAAAPGSTAMHYSFSNSMPKNGGRNHDQMNGEFAWGWWNGDGSAAVQNFWVAAQQAHVNRWRSSQNFKQQPFVKATG